MKTLKFKMTELGPIPVDWDVKRLGDVAPLKRGFDLPTSHLQDGPYPVVYSNGIGAYHNKAMCSAPGLITGRSGTIGKFTYIESGRYWPHNTALWVTSFNGNAPLFLKYLYSTLKFEDFSTGTGVPTLNRNNVHEYKVAIPPLAEQKAIAEALSDVDELLAAMTTLIEKKRAIKQGAMQELLTGKKRLPGFGGKCRQESLETEDFNAEAQRRRGSECKMTEVGLIPVDWEVKRLGEIGESIRGVSFKPEQTSHTLIPNSTMLLRANNIQNNQIVCQDVVYVMNECIADYQQLIKGDVLICSANGSRNLVGKAAIWSKESSATFGAFMAVFRCSKGVDSCFVGYLFQSKHYRMQLDDILTGSAINNLNAKDIDELNFAFPSLAEQKAIAEVLSDMDAEIEALEAKRAKYESIKQGMMQELLTGKTRLLQVR